MYVELYTRPNCSFCDGTKQLLKSNNINFVEYKLDRDFTKSTLMEKFPGFPGGSHQFPVIVVDGFRIQGCNHLIKLLEESNNNSKILLNEGN